MDEARGVSPDQADSGDDSNAESAMPPAAPDQPAESASEQAPAPSPGGRFEPL